MLRLTARFIIPIACAALLGALASPTFAQSGPKTRFANWEFDLPPLLKQVEQTRDKLVLKLDPSIPGAGGTVTLRSGEPLKGDLAARVDAEWKQLIRGRKLARTGPPETTGLADGTEGLRRSAVLAGNGALVLDAYRTPGGVNFMIVDAVDETAAQMIDGAVAMLTMTAKLQPLTAVAGAGTAKPATGAPANPAPASPQAASSAASSSAPGLPAMPPAVQTAKKSSRDTEKTEIPRRNAARIKMVPSRAPNNQELAAYLRRIEGPVSQKLSKNAVSFGDSIYKDAKKRQFRADAIGNVAVGLWMMGHLEAALTIMGKAVNEDPAHAGNLNNYAALLNMAGGQQLALPILIKLEKDHPTNSTVLNNIAQAWFGLGDIAKAEEYLDKTLMRFPGHSQANFTKSVVAESKGNKTGAVEAMKKSMKQGYSEDKEGQLERLGYEMGENDFAWDVPRKPEPLKLHKFLQLVPAYYKSAADIPRASAEWGAFRDALMSASQALQAQVPAMQQATQQEYRKFAADAMSGKKRMSPLSHKFTLKHVTYGKLPQKLQEQLVRWNQETDAVARQVDELAQTANAALKNAKDAECSVREKITTNFMSQANSLWANHQRDAKLKEMIRWNEEWANLFMYYNTPGDASYQALLLDLKRGFLNDLRHLRHEHRLGGACGSLAVKPGSRGPLQHFEDLHCQKNINFTVPMIGKIHVNCHYISTEFNIGGVISGSTKEDLNTGEFVKGTVEIGIVSGGGSKQLGSDGPAPITGEVKVEAGGFIEFDKNGMSDIGITAGATAGVTADGVPGANVNIGATTRIGLNSGVGVQGSGVLSDVSSQTSW